MSGIILRKWQQNLVRTTAIAGTYFLLAQLGLLFIIPSSSFAVIWPASGFMLAVLLLTEKRSWPLTMTAVFATITLANLHNGNPLLVSLGFAFANSLESILAAFFLTYFVIRPGGPSLSFSKIREVVLFALVAVLASNALTAFVGALVPTFWKAEAYYHAWLTWFIEDGVGMCLLTPLIVTLAQDWRTLFRWRGWLWILELAALLTTIIIGSIIIFRDTDVNAESILRPYLILPFLIWAALRFHKSVPIFFVFIHGAVAAILSKSGTGPFAVDLVASPDSIISLQIYLGITSFLTLFLSAVNAERAQAMNALRSSQSFLMKAQKVANLGIYELDIAKGRWASSETLDLIFGICKTFERSVEGWVSLIHPEDREFMTAHFKNEVLGQHQRFNKEYRIIPNNDGIVRWVHGLGELEFNSRGEPIKMLGTIQDITDRKHAEQERIKAKQSAEEAAREKAKFLDTAAHELRTPVTAVSLLLQLAERQIKIGQPIPPTLFERLRGPIDRLVRLVVDLLDASRLERGQLVLSCSRADLASLITQCLDEFQVIAPRHRIVFAKPNAPIELDLDPVRICQVISNLLDNAVKYTPEDKSIEMAIELKPDAVRVSVTDHGAGISKLQQETLFQDFSRGTTDNVVRTSGLGLGLSISRSIIELHKGAMGVISEEGQGSTFYFELPITGGTTL